MITVKAMKGMNKMHNYYENHPHMYSVNAPMYNPYNIYSGYRICPFYTNPQMFDAHHIKQQSNWQQPSMEKKSHNDPIVLRDYGPNPFVVDIEDAAEQNRNFRIALWTGRHLQLTLMSLGIGEDIGLEMHPNVDQFIRIEEGKALVRMGSSQDNLNFQREIDDDYIAVIPAGKWHNVINTGRKPLKLYSVYAPPEHPHGTIHRTKSQAEAAEQNHR